MPSKKVKASKREDRRIKKQITFSPVPETAETMQSTAPHSSASDNEILTEVRLANGPHTPYTTPTGSPLVLSMESLAIQSPRPKDDKEERDEPIQQKEPEEEPMPGPSGLQQQGQQGKPCPHQRDNLRRYHPYRRPLIDFPPHQVFNPHIRPPPIPLRNVRVPDLRVRFAHLFGPDGRFLL